MYGCRIYIAYAMRHINMPHAHAANPQTENLESRAFDSGRFLIIRGVELPGPEGVSWKPWLIR